MGMKAFRRSLFEENPGLAKTGAKALAIRQLTELDNWLSMVYTGWEQYCLISDRGFSQFSL